MGIGGEPSTASTTMAVFTLHRAETDQQPASRCTFEQQVSEGGKKWVDVKLWFFYPSTGWVSGMGRGDGSYSVKHAKEFFVHLLNIGYIAA